MPDTPQGNLVAPIASQKEKVSLTIEGTTFPMPSIRRTDAREKLLAYLPVLAQGLEEIGAETPCVLSCAGLIVVFLPQPGGTVLAERAKDGKDAAFLIEEWEAAQAAREFRARSIETERRHDAYNVWAAQISIA